MLSRLESSNRSQPAIRSQPATRPRNRQRQLMAEELQSTFSAAEETSVVVHSMRQDELRMNKWHVIHIIRKVRDQEETLPKGDWIVASFALAIALTLPLVSADFKDALGIGGAALEGDDLVIRV